MEWKDILKSDGKQSKASIRQTRIKQNRDSKRGAASMVDSQDHEDESVYAFPVDNKKQEKIEVTVGGWKLNMIVDSGASTNIINKQTWEWLKKNKVKCKSTCLDRKLYLCTSQTPLDVMGTFCCDVIAGTNAVNTEFCMINGEGDPLLGQENTTDLGVLIIRIEVAVVHASSKNIGNILQEKYPNVLALES